MGGKIILSLVALLVVVSSRGEVYLAAGELYPSTVDIFLLAPRGNSPKQMEEMTTEWAIRYLVRKLAGEFLKGNVTSNVAVEKLATTIISLKLTGSPLTGVASKSRERPFWVYKKENRGFDGIKVLLEIGNRRVELYLARSIDAQALWNNKIRNKLRNGKRNLFLEGKVAAIVAAETKEISFFALEKTDLGRLSTIVHDLKVPFQAIGFLELFFTTEGEREEYRGRVARIRGIFGKYDEDLADPKKGLVTALANLYSTLNTIKEFCLWGHQFISATTTREATELGERNFSKALRLIEEFKLAWEGATKNQRFDLVTAIINYMENITASLWGNGIKVNFRLQAGGVSDFFVFNNRNAVERLLDNLINNALDAFRKNGATAGEIAVTMNFNEEGGIGLTVSDNAGGIAEGLLIRDKDKIQKLFGRGNSTKSAEEPGEHGLGLHFVHKTVVGLDGEIVASNNTRGGATFTLVFPSECIVPEEIEMYDDDSLEQLKRTILAARETTEDPGLSATAEKLLQQPETAVWEKTFPLWIYYELMGYVNSLGGRNAAAAKEILRTIRKMTTYANLNDLEIEPDSDIGKYFLGLLDLKGQALELEAEKTDAELLTIMNRYAVTAYQWYGRTQMIGCRIGLQKNDHVCLKDEHELLTLVRKLYQIHYRCRKEPLAGINLPNQFSEVGLAYRAVLDGKMEEAVIRYSRAVRLNRNLGPQVVYELRILETLGYDIEADRVQRALLNVLHEGDFVSGQASWESETGIPAKTGSQTIERAV